MRTDADLVERAVVGAAAVVVALGHVAFDGVVGFFVCETHTKYSSFIRFGISMSARKAAILENFSEQPLPPPAAEAADALAERFAALS